MLLNYSQ